MKFALVPNFCPINRVLKRPGYPNKGSGQLIKRILPETKYFVVFDLTSGFHRVLLPEVYCNLFAIVLAMGKYRYKHLPHGTMSLPTSLILSQMENSEEYPG